MKLEVRFRAIEASQALRAHVVRRVQIQLRAFEGAVDAVAVRIEDVNGPKGGVDKRCHVAVRGPALGPVTVEDLNGNARTAVDSAIARAARAVGREVARARVSRRDHTLERAS